MLAALAETGNVTEATTIARINRDTHYDWLKTDPDYAKAAESAMESAADRLEREALRRAVEGVEEPVYQGGKKVGVVQKYSDTLLIFLLKGARPHKYKERLAITYTPEERIAKLMDGAGVTREEAEAAIREAERIVGKG